MCVSYTYGCYYNCFLAGYFLADEYGVEFNFICTAFITVVIVSGNFTGEVMKSLTLTFVLRR